MFDNLFSSLESEDSDDNPGRMRGSEPIQGYVVAAVLFVVCVLDLTIKKGAGAPKHPSQWAPSVGLILSVALALTMRFRNRLASPFIAIFASFFATLSKAPKVLSTPHIIALVVAVGFAVNMTLHQRRDQKALTPNMTPAQRRAAADARRRRRKGEPEPPSAGKRPPPSARYTPPKSATPPKSKTKR
jgi:hypothetical protein